MAHLLVVAGKEQGAKFPFRDGCTIGREAGNDVQLLDGEASRRHASIGRTGSVWRIVDLGSSNGTRVNDKVIHNAVLHTGDRIEIGTTILLFSGSVGPDSSSGSTGSTGSGSMYTVAPGVRIVGGDGIGGDGDSMPDASRIVSRFTPSSLSGDATGSFGGSLGEPSGKPFGRSRKGQTSESPPGPSNQPMGRRHDDGAAKSDAGKSVVGKSDVGKSDIGKSDVGESLEVMYRASLAVGRTENLDELLDRVLRLVFDWTEADRGCVMLRHESTGNMQPAARCDRGELDQRTGAGDDKPLEPIAISRTILDYVLASKQGVRTTDAADDKRFDEAASILQGRVREAICVPLQGRYGIVGALYIDTDSSPGQIVRRGTADKFNDEHLRLMTAIGHQAAIAIEDTQHYWQLLQSERLAAMGQTIATLSHHVKNILQGIRGGSYLIQTGLDRDDNDAVRRGWSIVDRNQSRISNLVMDMLTYSKDRVPELTVGDLNETTGDAVGLMRPAAAQRGVTLRDELTDLPPATFDADAMHRAVMNLITNAIDAAAGSGEGSVSGPAVDRVGDPVVDPVVDPVGEPSVVVRTRMDGENWIVEVTDTGPGVAPEDRERIFSLFESGKGARGTGLGLPVCAKIMQEHGGRIEVDGGSGTRRGATFRLVLPPNERTTGETILEASGPGG